MARLLNPTFIGRVAPVGRWRRRGLSVVASLALAVAGLLVVAPSAQAIDVVSMSPVSGEEVVSVGTNVTVTFSEAANGVSTGTFTLERLGGGTVSAGVSGSGASWSLNPDASLVPGVGYTVSLSSAITDVNGVPLTSQSWGFTTDAPAPPPPPPGDTTSPTVTDKSPSSGATGVAPDSTVTATFDEAVQGVNESTFTLERESTGTEVPAAVFRRGTSDSWSLNPDSRLLESTVYTVRLSGGAGGIRDLADNALSSTSWSFRTSAGTPDDNTRPRVTDESPGSGARGVSVDSTVTATFNEAVQGVDEFTFTLERSSTGTEVPAVVFRRGSSERWTLSPDENLRHDTRYVVQLFGGPDEIRDLDDNALFDTDWSFTTTRGFEEGDRPEIVSRSPRSGATHVSRHADVRVTFNESVRGVDGHTFRLTNTRTDEKVPAFVFRDGSSRHWVLEPDRSLRRGTRYVVTLRGGRSDIRDRDGNRLSSTSWSFRVRD